MWTKEFSKKYHEEELVEKEVILLPVFKEILNQKKWNNLIDLGCGSGYYTRRFVGYGKKVVGVDCNMNQLNIAQKIENETKLGIKYIQSNLTNLKSIESNSFDFAFLNFVIVEISDDKVIKQIFKEAHRILRKKGFLIIGEVHPHNINRKDAVVEKNILEKEGNYFSNGSKAISNTLLKSGGYIVFNDDYHYTLEFILNNLRKSGFVLDTLRELSYNEPYPSHIIIVMEK